MNVTPEEAQAALASIESTSRYTRSFLRGWSYYMALWGSVWTLGFLLTQLTPQWIYWIWGGMFAVGMVGSTILGILQSKNGRARPGTHTTFVVQQYGIFNAVLWPFVVLWFVVFPLNQLQVGLLWITTVMFSSIIAGAWFKTPLLIGLGIGVTLMTVLGYYLLPHYFWLWSAIFAGLPMIIINIYQSKKS